MVGGRISVPQKPRACCCPGLAADLHEQGVSTRLPRPPCRAGLVSAVALPAMGSVCPGGTACALPISLTLFIPGCVYLCQYRQLSEFNIGSVNPFISLAITILLRNNQQ